MSVRLKQWGLHERARWPAESPWCGVGKTARQGIGGGGRSEMVGVEDVSCRDTGTSDGGTAGPAIVTALPRVWQVEGTQCLVGGQTFRSEFATQTTGLDATERGGRVERVEIDADGSRVDARRDLGSALRL